MTWAAARSFVRVAQRGAEPDAGRCWNRNLEGFQQEEGGADSGGVASLSPRK